MKLGNIVADFRTALSAKIVAGGSTGTLQSITDDDGVLLPNGRYFFTLDGDNSQKEHISCTLTGTALTDIKSVSRQGVETANVVRDHRVGASVVITNFAHILYINQMLSGDLDFDGDDLTGIKSISVTEDPGAGDVTELATVNYVNGVAVAGASDMNTTTKGIAEEATEAEIDANTAAGATAARLAVNPSTLATSKYGVRLPSAAQKTLLDGITADAAEINQLDGATISAAELTEAGTFFGATDITGAQAETLTDGSDAGDLHYHLEKTGVLTQNLTSSTTVTIAHGLGRVPSFVGVELLFKTAQRYGVQSIGSFDGTNNSCIYSGVISGPTATTGTSTTYAIRAFAEGYGDLSGVITVDATNITITWTRTSGPTGTAAIKWNAK